MAAVVEQAVEQQISVGARRVRFPGPPWLFSADSLSILAGRRALFLKDKS